MRIDGAGLDVILRRFEAPDEVREMVKGRFEVVRIGGLTIGRATAGSGPSTWGRAWALSGARWSTWDWCWPASPPWRSRIGCWR
jgi:hypothetical protein